MYLLRTDFNILFFILKFINQYFFKKVFFIDNKYQIVLLYSDFFKLINYIIFLTRKLDISTFLVKRSLLTKLI